ncbi:hypothetical protein V5F79_22420 [Xanthobacter flavus]|uniref:hypothetical protein n=1 Tax=Xanthobacter flavus TaxID=281 RepID=UPI00372757A3
MTVTEAELLLGLSEYLDAYAGALEASGRDRKARLPMYTAPEARTIARVLREAAEGWRPISEATGTGPILGLQTTPGDNENMVGTCRPYDANGTRIWIGLGGLMPDYFLPLPAPPSETSHDH